MWPGIGKAITHNPLSDIGVAFCFGGSPSTVLAMTLSSGLPATLVAL